jgi:hypothetical protein
LATRLSGVKGHQLRRGAIVRRHSTTTKHDVDKRLSERSQRIDKIVLATGHPKDIARLTFAGVAVEPIVLWRAPVEAFMLNVGAVNTTPEREKGV